MTGLNSFIIGWLEYKWTKWSLFLDQTSKADEMISLSHLYGFLNPMEWFGWRRSVKFQLYRNGFSPMILCLSKWNGDWSSPEGESGTQELASHDCIILWALCSSEAYSTLPWSQVKGVVWNGFSYFFFLPEILKLIVWHEHLNRVTRFQWHDRHQFIHSFSAPYPFQQNGK